MRRTRMLVLAFALAAAGSVLLAEGGLAVPSPAVGAGPGATLRPGADPSPAARLRALAGGLRFAYSTTFQFSFSEQGPLAVGPDGSAYVASTSGPAPTASFQTCVEEAAASDALPNNIDVMLTKFDPSGSRVEWAIVFGSPFGDELATGIAIDPAGNVVVAGVSKASKRCPSPTTPGALDATRDGKADAFVFKLDPTGSQLLFSTLLGGSGFDYAEGVGLDDAGNVYLGGTTESPDFPTTPGTLPGGRPAEKRPDVFVAKLDPTLSTLLYSTLLGGTDLDDIDAFELDRAGNAYVAGWSRSRNFPTTRGAYQRRGTVFVAKLDPSGTRLRYSTFVGRRSDAAIAELAVDAAGNAHLVGTVRYDDVNSAADDFPITPGALDDNLFSQRVFALKLDAAGSRVLYSTYLPQADVASGVAIDAAGSAWIAGSTASKTFPTTKNALDRTNRAGDRFRGPGDIFLVRLDGQGRRLLYSTLLGGRGFEWHPQMALGPGGDVYLAGQTGGDFPTTEGAYSREQPAPASGYGAGYLVRLTRG